MNIPEPNFLESIKFESNFPPFKENTEIKFGGEKEVQNMIEFYLKNQNNLLDKSEQKTEKEIFDNAKRFKINCVLGNNGGGKSRLFRGLYALSDLKKFFRDIDNHEKSVITFKMTNGKSGNLMIEPAIEDDEVFGATYESNYQKFIFFPILDDFFKLSGNIDLSMNKEVLNEENYNKFYCEVYNFLNNDYYLIEVFRKFLNITDSYIAKVEINGIGENKINIMEIDFIYFEIKNSDKKLQYTFLLYLINNIKGIIEYTLQNPKYSEKILRYVNLLIDESEEYDEIKSIFEQYKFYFEYLSYQEAGGITELDINDILDNFSSYNLDLLSDTSDDFYQKIHEGVGDYDAVKNDKAEIELFDNDLTYDQSDNKIKCQEREDEVIKEVNNNLSGLVQSIKSNLFNLNSYGELEEYWINEKESFNFSEHQDKKYFFSNIFNLDLIFQDGEEDKKTFENLSAGEKTMLIRFTNIYKEILKQKEKNGKTDFLIHIDEPDLHLHLDWQRQYIQKLIDVFSTLDSKINLHFVIATHSPFIISDLPTECMVVLDKSEENIHEGKFVEVKEYSEKIKTKNKDGEKIEEFKHQTFGANYVDIIKNGFFFENQQMLMGSFAQDNIEKASKKLKAKLFIDTLGIDKDNFGEKKDTLTLILKEIGEEEISNFGDFESKIIEIFQGVEEIRENIGDEFLQDNLMYLN